MVARCGDALFFFFVFVFFFLLRDLSLSLSLWGKGGRKKANF